MAYYFYLDKMLLPIAPSKLQLKVNNQNDTVNLINDGEINILKKAGLTDVSFDASIPQVKYPFAIYKNGFQEASVYLDELERMKASQEPFSFKVTRTLPSGKMLFDTEMKVSLEDYKVTEEAKNGFDMIVSISLKQYKDYGTKKITIVESKATVTKARAYASSPAPKTIPKSYTVKKGDTLWGIAKYYYGDGGKYAKIYNSNKDRVKNANSINIGQVLTIPV